MPKTVLLLTVVIGLGLIGFLILSRQNPGRKTEGLPNSNGVRLREDTPTVSSWADSSTQPSNSPTNSLQSTNTYSTTTNPTPLSKPTTPNSPPTTTIPMNPKTATLKTSAGDIIIELNSNQTPKTVQNFIDLATKKFYDNTIFHRVINGFMIQGGDPEGTGRGGPGYRFDDEPFTGEYTRGTVAMANAGPNTNGSQFFIMHQDNALPKNYVIFGRVVQGLDTVDKIATAPTDPSGERSRPVNPVKVISVTISK